MQDESLAVELQLVAVPLPPELEEAYWLAIETLVELVLTEKSAT